MDVLLAARQFSRVLKNCAILEYVERLGRKDWEKPSGRYVRVARVDKHVWLSVAKGRYFSDEGEGFWIGFECQDPKNDDTVIRRLAGNLKTTMSVSAMGEDQQQWPNDAKSIATIKDGYLIAERYFETKRKRGVITRYPFFGLGVYFAPGREFNILLALEFVCNVLKNNGFESRWVVDDATRDIFATATGRDATTRERLIQARLGQGPYRQSLMERWGQKCAVLGISQAEALRASHVVAFARCANDDERLDPDNGLLLSALLDVLFDRHLITFDDEGDMIYAREIAEQPELKKLLGARLREKPEERLAAYLKRHRAQFQALRL